MFLSGSDVPAPIAPTDDRRYKAPALEKGLDILELLSTTATPLTLSTIVTRLGRSHGELFRMVQVLQFRGYLEQDPATDGYRLTDQLFSLGMQQPRTAGLVEIALPVMRRLAMETGQSCHMALHSRGEIVVVARMESGEQLGFSVRVGYRRPLAQAASGLILYAFQSAEVRERWETMFDPPLKGAELAAFRARADAVRGRNVEAMASHIVQGVTDLSAPVLRGPAAAAALTIPYLSKIGVGMTQADATRAVQAAAAEISAQLVESDGRA